MDEKTHNIEDPYAEMIDGIQQVVEAFTGMKNQFINAGWTIGGAEQMVVTLVRSQGGRE